MPMILPSLRNDLAFSMISDFQVLVFLLSSALVLLTPGPTNTLLAAAGLGRGWRDARPLILFELMGYLIAISGWGILLASIGKYYPWVSVAVRVVCSGYLLYVAVKMWMSTEKPPIARSQTIGPGTVLVTTVLNPKGLLFASTIFPPQAFEHLQGYAIAMALFACVVLPIGMVWVMLGALIGSGRGITMDPLRLQRALAVVIVVFSATLVWSTVQ